MKGPFSIVRETSVGTGLPYDFVFAVSKSPIHLKLISPTFITIGRRSSIPSSCPIAFNASTKNASTVSSSYPKTIAW